MITATAPPDLQQIRRFTADKIVTVSAALLLADDIHTDLIRSGADPAEIEKARVELRGWEAALAVLLAFEDMLYDDDPEEIPWPIAS